MFRAARNDARRNPPGGFRNQRRSWQYGSQRQERTLVVPGSVQAKHTESVRVLRYDVCCCRCCCCCLSTECLCVCLSGSFALPSDTDKSNTLEKKELEVLLTRLVGGMKASLIEATEAQIKRMTQAGQSVVKGESMLAAFKGWTLNISEVAADFWEVMDQNHDGKVCAILRRLLFVLVFQIRPRPRLQLHR